VSEPETSDRRFRFALSVAISLAALSVAAVHVALPDKKIDAITVGLLVVAVIPWLAPILKSIEGPGGWKVEFRELEQKVEEKAREVEELSTRVQQLEGLVFHGEAAPELRESLSGALASFDAYLQELGLGRVGELPSIRIEEDFDNAYYSLDREEIVLGRSVVENRYLLFRLWGMHVLSALAPATWTDLTDSPLVRGLADFLAASFMGEAAYRHTPKMRHLHNEGRLDELALPEDGDYEAGEVWGGVLWELRRALGAERAPRIIVSAWIDAEGRINPFLDAVLKNLPEDERPVAEDIFNRRIVTSAAAAMRTTD
jgi:hypothetical protein